MRERTWSQSSTASVRVRHRPWRACLLALAVAAAVIGTGCSAEDAGQSVPPPAASTQETPPPASSAGPGVTSPPENPRLAALFAAVKARPEDAAAHHALGRMLHEAHRRDEGLVHFQRAVELDPSLTNLFDLAVAQTAMSRLREAEATYRRVLTLIPDEPRALQNLGNVLLNQGRKDEAIAALTRALRVKPDLLLARYQLAGIYKFYGQFEEAYGMYQGVLDTTPHDAQEQQAVADSLYQIASIDVSRGAYSQAEQNLARLLQLVPDHKSAHYMRGQALLHLGRDDEAEQEFDTHVRLLASRPANSPMASSR